MASKTYYVGGVRLLCNDNRTETISAESILEIRLIAQRNCYKEISCNTTSRVISFADEHRIIRINVYYTTGTVATCLNHPASGKTQLFRRNVTLKGLEDIFKNPRVHTGAGYYTTEESSSQSPLPEKQALLEHKATLEKRLESTSNMIKIIEEREERVRAKRKAEEAAEAKRKRLCLRGNLFEVLTEDAVKVYIHTLRQGDETQP